MKQQTPRVTDAVLTDLLYVSDVHVSDFSNQSLCAFLFGLILKTNFPCAPSSGWMLLPRRSNKGGGGDTQTHGWMAKTRGKTWNNKVCGVTMTRL